MAIECGICGRPVEELAFNCRYCRGYFCSEHRLPPNHDCIFLSDFMRQPEKDREFIEYLHGRHGSAGQRLAATLKNAVVLRFSKTELAHLALGTALVTAVGMSIFHFSLQPEYLAVFVSAFLLHEFAHKFLAQFYRAWAEFRVLLYGAVITAISALPFFPFKFIAPGAVFIGGPISEGRNGRISLVGPLTNIALGAGFALAYYLDVSSPDLMLTGTRFNSWIAIFNLIPFMGLDGSKIFAWNKLVWVAALAASVGLYVLAGFTSGRGLFGLF
ncbi:AN1-type zinc finger domain-containing protein [Nitrososphaera sp.]|uniref:AN1-type zinc finger domain-containing protein n=1 Tax=Nitrososphaera sp. TaxID=1971748 RepID=UPI00307DFD7A